MNTGRAQAHIPVLKCGSLGAAALYEILKAYAQCGRCTLSFLTPSKADLNLWSASPSTWACQPRSTILQSACMHATSSFIQGVHLVVKS